MSQICITSERVLELCAQARYALPHFQSRGFQTVRVDMLPFTYEHAAGVLDQLEALSRQASKLAGQTPSSVCLDSTHLSTLAKLLEMNTGTVAA